MSSFVSPIIREEEGAMGPPQLIEPQVLIMTESKESDPMGSGAVCAEHEELKRGLDAAKADLVRMTRDRDEWSRLSDELASRIGELEIELGCLRNKGTELALMMLSNMGHDTSCGACMAQAFTGSTGGSPHTCKAKSADLPDSDIAAVRSVLRGSNASSHWIEAILDKIADRLREKEAREPASSALDELVAKVGKGFQLHINKKGLDRIQSEIADEIRGLTENLRSEKIRQRAVSLRLIRDDGPMTAEDWECDRAKNFSKGGSEDELVDMMEELLDCHEET
jgi:hypothetical protein